MAGSEIIVLMIYLLGEHFFFLNICEKVSKISRIFENVRLRCLFLHTYVICMYILDP